jgi:hypothetical protein
VNVSTGLLTTLKVMLSSAMQGHCANAKRLAHIDHRLAELCEFVGIGELKRFSSDLNLRDSQTVSDDGDSVH